MPGLESLGNNIFTKSEIGFTVLATIDLPFKVHHKQPPHVLTTKSSHQNPFFFLVQLFFFLLLLHEMQEIWAKKRIDISQL
uniref:Protein yippee-like n=1 Tax=Rhizophora mucronata TaxID=61149 RepID=A0A2P2JS23_RHIMU